MSGGDTRSGPPPLVGRGDATAHDPKANGARANAAGPSPGHAAVGQLKLELLAEIAVGSTTRVDLCRSRGPHAAGELLAVKRLLPQLAHDPVLSQRFLDEVWMTSALHHPNVVRVIGWGNDDRGAYLAVELVQGVSLARLMKTVFETGEDFTERLAVHLGACIARGLGAAHGLRSDRGEPLHLVHRNLTPSNVLLGFQGDVKVADFGLAKANQRLSTTTASSLPNRPSTHVAPEEIRGESVDQRSDLFSLGVVLYEVLTRRLPFAGANDAETVQKIVRDAPTDPLIRRPKLDRNLARIVLRCLEKDPAARWQSAEDVARELESWLFAHGWTEENEITLGRFVRRNAMRQMHWFERAIAGGAREPAPRPAPSFRPAPASADKPRPPEKSRAEVTAVERPARRRRADSATPASDRPGPPKTSPAAAADIADPPTLFEEDSEEAPTLAMRRDDLPPELLAKLRAARGGPVPTPPGPPPPPVPPAPAPGPATSSASTAPPASVPRPITAPRSKAPPPLPARDTSAPPAPRVEPVTKPTPPAPTEWSRAIDRIRLEIDTHRTSAASMRESAQQLLAAADDEDAARRRAEQALVLAQEAARLATSGASADAKIKLDEALRLAGVQR